MWIKGSGDKKERSRCDCVLQPVSSFERKLPVSICKEGLVTSVFKWWVISFHLGWTAVYEFIEWFTPMAVSWTGFTYEFKWGTVDIHSKKDCEIMFICSHKLRNYLSSEECWVIVYLVTRSSRGCVYSEMNIEQLCIYMETYV